MTFQLYYSVLFYISGSLKTLTTIYAVQISVLSLFPALKKQKSVSITITIPIFPGSVGSGTTRGNCASRHAQTLCLQHLYTLPGIYQQTYWRLPRDYLFILNVVLDYSVGDRDHAVLACSAWTVMPHLCCRIQSHRLFGIAGQLALSKRDCLPNGRFHTSGHYNATVR